MLYLDDACKTFGIEPITPHDFRHTYVTICLERGIDIHVVQKRVHHAMLSTTERYDHTFRIVDNNPADDIFDKYNEAPKNIVKLNLKQA